MIPLRDTIPHRHPPLMTWTLIAMNVAVYWFQITLSPGQLEFFLTQLGIIPVRFLHDFGVEEALTVLTAMFLHGGWFHIIGNMWSLWIFGDNVEDRLGRAAFVMFYLACGAVAAAVHIALSPSSIIPTIGASGAIAGVMGAYMVFFPYSRVITLVPILFFFHVIEVPAYFFLAFWFLLQLFSGLASLSFRDTVLAHGVAWWAHIGGFAAGLVIAWGWVRAVPRHGTSGHAVFP